MTATPANWRPQVKAGDVLRISATYNTTRASWYESMGIMVVWEAWNTEGGTDPFAHPIDERGHVTHGHLAEDNNHGGAYSLGVNPTAFPDCSRNTVTIAQFQYDPGDFTSTGMNRCIPTVTEGHSITFVNDDASPLSPGNPLSPTKAYMDSVFHTVTVVPEPVRAEHRHLLPAGQRHRQL